jgi:hypothetical protein
MYNKDFGEYGSFLKSWVKVLTETTTGDMYRTAVIRKLFLVRDAVQSDGNAQTFQRNTAVP